MIALTTGEKIWCAIFCLLYGIVVWAFWMTFNETGAEIVFRAWMQCLVLGALYCLISTVLHPLFGWFFLYRWIDWVLTVILFLLLAGGWLLVFTTCGALFFLDLFTWLRLI